MLLFRVIKERETGLEPAASTLARSRSTNWATRACFCMLPCIEGIKLIIYSSLRYFREAGDGNRTHVSSLEGWCSTIELHPHIFCPVWITRTNNIITENLYRVKTHYQFSVIMPRTGIEPVTRGFSVLCSTDWAIWANQFACANSDKIISRTIVQVYLLRLGLKLFCVYLHLQINGHREYAVFEMGWISHQIIQEQSCKFTC